MREESGKKWKKQGGKIWKYTGFKRLISTTVSDSYIT